ncbi:FAM151 family protein [Marixanthomonas ophiurae]|uniref:DUF2181 domain-containing protein n=1 Tax=Marixanthomonas ophiurae TaxID=387659 RepID=A0A3E1QAN1_9FLAO|nr:DUF2181 domain-containing protein [Marixanthomonas ophiurae]RFN59192.1 DUF2181 domain-containing protein [Marixanthomonas ophiurae]
MMRSKKVKIILFSILALVVLRYAYKFSPYKIEFLGHYDKVWAHRVNSTDKLNSATTFFKGIELDLVYQKQTNSFDVNHPPAESIDLTFADYLSTLKPDERPYLWLDIKNLNPENATSIHEKLISIFSSLSYPFETILVETKHPEALAIFQQSGFKTSYYLPYEMYKKDPQALKTAISTVKKFLATDTVFGISASYKDYEILKNHFPKRTKYIWATGRCTVCDYTEIRELLNDTTVKVVLSTFRSFKGNR